MPEPKTKTKATPKFPDGYVIVGDKDQGVYLRTMSRLKSGKLFFPWKHCVKLRDYLMFCENHLIQPCDLDCEAFIMSGLSFEFKMS